MKQQLKKFYSQHRKLKISITAMLLVFLLIVTMLLTTYFPAMFIRAVFDRTEQSPSENYMEISENITVYKDVEYPSKHKDNTLDIYLPSTGKPKATVIFMHGGGYVGGDKRETACFAASLSFEGYAVVALNYERAPQARYPVPLIQLGEVCDFVKSNTDYNFGEKGLVLAGSSAGAHCVAQFTAIQTSNEYAALTDIQPTLRKEEISALLLYCGPYNFERFATSGNGFMKFMMNRSVQAYLGRYNWRDEYAAKMTLVNHVTSDYPDTFITDGNIGSFESDARELADKLKDLDVRAEAYYVEDEVAGHEYQYDMQNTAAKAVFEKTVEFLDKYAAPKSIS